MDQISEAYATVAELAEALGVRNIGKLPGMWEVQIDDAWKISVNGHNEAIGHVPPYHMAVEFNGWPAGIFGPGGGIIAAGEAANEATLIAALRARIDRARQPPHTP